MHPSPTTPPAELVDLKAELKRVARVADILCTAHAGLRDRYRLFATYLDVFILLLSAWVVALAFVEPRINVSLTPFGFDPQIWVGLLGVAVFGLSIVQLRVDWKGRSDAHARAFEAYAKVKGDASFLLAAGREVTEQICQPIFIRYDAAGVTPIPESEFLKQKRRHLLKVAVSRHLDDHPAASIRLMRLRLWIRDNLSSHGSRAP